ncbi:hypothetical protein OUZ56_007765 [Daphnia magna]|uniref:Uncharacterized protein n=1 Tax=Daphnia magna TaxID=35525 RepID=A0ABR0AAZ9_9CRUS|nr:hypothetical protein OUZ56_007765 [Daphnia magna]
MKGKCQTVLLAKQHKKSGTLMYTIKRNMSISNKTEQWTDIRLNFAERLHCYVYTPLQVMLGLTVVTICIMNNWLYCKSVSTNKLNYLVLAFSLAIAIIDCLKIPFAADRKYNE